MSMSESENGRLAFVDSEAESINTSLDSDRVTKAQQPKRTSTDTQNPSNAKPMNRTMLGE
eukprot:Ihof_evm2s153 gene=Ihof_evmTU2s153